MNRIEQGSEKTLSVFEGDSNQIHTVQVDQVESLKAELSCPAAADCVLKFLTVQSAIAIKDYDFAIDDCGFGSDGSHSRHEIREFASPVFPVPAPETHVAVIELE